MHRYRELKVWQKGRQLVVEIYQLTKSFPETEKFGITSQIRRSVISIPTNIAEGCGRGSNPELNRFCDIAVGSSFETESLLILAHDLNYIDDKSFKEISEKISEIERMLFSFKQQLK